MKKKKKNTDINKEKWVKGQMGESQNTDSEEGRKIDNILQCRYTCTIITTQGGLAFEKKKKNVFLEDFYNVTYFPVDSQRPEMLLPFTRGITTRWPHIIILFQTARFIYRVEQTNYRVEKRSVSRNFHRRSNRNDNKHVPGVV